MRRRHLAGPFKAPGACGRHVLSRRLVGGTIFSNAPGVLSPPGMKPSRLLAVLAVALLVSLAPEVLAAASSGSGAPLSRIERISIEPRADGAGDVIRFHLSDKVRVYSMEQAGDLVEVVLYDAQVARRMRQANPRGSVRGYSVDRDGDRSIARFTVEPGVTAQAYADDSNDDLLISLTRQRRASRGGAGWGGGVVARTPRTRPTHRQPQPADNGTSTPFEAPVETPAPRTRPTGPANAEGSVVPIRSNWHLDTIVLDAGHGGDDHGGVGNGTSDKEVAWGVVSRLGPMLERELGVRVVYTRHDDTFVELRERGRIANREGGKLFISVHANAGPSTAYGTETFFLAQRKSDNARGVMERENSVIHLERDPSLYDHYDVEGDIMQALAMSAYEQESQMLAGLVEREFVAAGRHSRGVKQGPFLVLWAASMPAILVETGFVTNPDEARHISSRDGLDETARAIFNAVRAYKQTYDRGLRLADGS